MLLLPIMFPNSLYFRTQGRALILLSSQLYPSSHSYSPRKVHRFLKSITIFTHSTKVELLLLTQLF